MEEQANQNTSKSSSKVGLALVGIIVVAFIGIVAYQSQNKNQSQTTTQTSPAVQQEARSNPTNETGSETTETASAYKDGTYSADGNYVSPGGQEELGVTLTITNGIVTDSQVEVKATRPMSKERQTDFATHYKAEVVGKNIDELSLSRVSGSSLSPKGFNDAVEKIKSQAKS